jgi:uncharacterized protein YoxC
MWPAHLLWTERALASGGSALKKKRRTSAEVLREIMPMTNLDNQTIQLVFIAVTALAIVMQAVILLAIFVSVRKAAKSVTDQVENLRSSVMPIIDTTRDLINRVAPKVEATAADLAEIAHGLRVQTVQMESAANEIVDRVRRQTGRLDKMFSGVLDGVDRAGAFVAEAVSKPVRQISGLLASLKAIIESLRNSSPAHHETHAPSDKDMFV